MGVGWGGGRGRFGGRGGGVDRAGVGVGVGLGVGSRWQHPGTWRTLLRVSLPSRHKVTFPTWQRCGGVGVSRCLQHVVKQMNAVTTSLNILSEEEQNDAAGDSRVEG